MPGPARTSRRPSLRPAFVALGALALLLLTGCDGNEPRSPPAPGPQGSAPATPAGLPGAGPRVVIDLPAEQGHVRTQMVRVRGRAADVEQLFLNSTRVACQPDGAFDVRLELSGGEGEIVARDGARPEPPLLVRHVMVDLIAPVLELTEIPGTVDGGQLYRRRVEGARATLRGRATDRRPGVVETVTIDGRPCALEEDGSFRAEVDVPAVEHRFELEALDRAGNRAHIGLTLVRG